VGHKLFPQAVVEILVKQHLHEACRFVCS
jgi:hypothetical protein